MRVPPRHGYRGGMKTCQRVLPFVLPPSWDPPECWDSLEVAATTEGERTEAVGDDWSDSRQVGNLAPDGSHADLSRYVCNQCSCSFHSCCESFGSWRGTGRDRAARTLKQLEALFTDRHNKRFFERS